MTKFQETLQSLYLERPMVMGILNVTPDSFSDGGQFTSLDKMKSHVESMVEAGVDIIDVGGESTRPGAQSVGLQEELDRVLPIIEWVAGEQDVLLSVDTYKPEVMSEAIKFGVDLVNDVNALQADGAIELVADSKVSVCLMHKQGDPATMQANPEYEDVVLEVSEFLQQRAQACLQAGISKDRIVLDPGFGFGKALQHNIRLFEEMDRLIGLEYPLLVGVSRKKMIGQLLAEAGEEQVVEQRIVGSVAAAILASMKGANILRVHDVKETVQAVKVMQALL